MKYTKKLSLLLLLLSLVLTINAQDMRVTGTVKSATTGEPLVGAYVIVKGTQKGTFTDAEGKFSLSVPQNNPVIEVKFVGFVSRELTVNEQTELIVELKEDIQAIEELVVIGYGQQKKEEVTTSMVKLKSENFLQGMVKSPAQLLQGKVAGLGISNASGSPTDGVQFMIRGTSTLASGQDPLVVIDGVPGGSLYSIAPEDIEDITVLKDGSAAAIYGTRGTNGVIIINTKKGLRREEPTVEYNGSLSVENIANNRDMLKADDYIRLKNDTVTMIGKKTAAVIFGNLDYGDKTDWVDAITRTAYNQVHNLAFKSGNEKSNFTAGVTYREQDGTLLNSDRTSYNLRLNANHSTFNDRIRMNLNISNSTYKDHYVWTYAYLTALRMNPTLPIYNEDGSYFEWGSTQKPYNPVALLKEETNENNWTQFLSSGRLTFEPLKNWNINFTGAVQRNGGMNDKWSTFKHPNTTVLQNNGNVWKWATQIYDYTGEITTDYTLNIGKSNLGVMAGYSYQYYLYNNSYMYTYDFATDQFAAFNLTPSRAIKNGLADMAAYKEDSKLIAFFGRATYNYDQKYLLMLTFRHEGSSKFGANHKWGNFPAVSIGWRINREQFMQNLNWLNELKLRAGYGVTGTVPNASYMSLPLLTFDDSKMAYMNGVWVKGVVPAQNYNPDLKWETKQEYNVGFDFGLFANRINGTLDLYQRLTSDLIYNYTVPTPPNKASTTYANAGKIENKGVEISLNALLINKKDLRLSMGTNFSYNKNLVKSIESDVFNLDALYAGSTGSPIQQATHKIVAGEPLGNFWGWKVAKLDKDGKWLYFDRNGDTIKAAAASEADKYVIGNGIPKIFSGLNISLNYKNLDVYVNFRGAFKFQVWNQFRSHYENFSVVGQDNIPRSAFNKPAGSDSYILNSPAYNDYFIENGDYVKLDNVTIGYTFKLPAAWKISKCRLYISGINLHTFTNYSGLDPEVSILGLSPGIEYYDTYPKTRTITMGINLAF
ncbi:MAG: TonB-dependent receptor [Bacteroidales bacterium]|nr:TonB-dependent receptor [Bacteroidales bacterium]